MFYHNYVDLCNKRNISPSAAAEDMGFHRSDVTRWSKGSQPRQATLQKIADYFGVPVQELMGEEKTPIQKDERKVDDDDIMFALFGGEVSDAKYEEVKRFAKFLKERDRDDEAGG